MYRPGSQSILQSLLGPVRARVPSQGLLGRRESNLQQAGGSASTPPTSTPSSSLPPSPKRSQQQQQQDGDGLQPLEAPTPADGAAATDIISSSGGNAAAVAVASGAAGASGQPLATLMDVSSGEFAKLLRNPAAYSAGALGKLSNSVTSTMSSLLVGKDGQPG